MCLQLPEVQWLVWRDRRVEQRGRTAEVVVAERGKGAEEDAARRQSSRYAKHR